MPRKLRQWITIAKSIRVDLKLVNHADVGRYFVKGIKEWFHHILVTESSLYSPLE